MTRDFLRRAENLLALKTAAGLLYAALEIRMGVEARLKSYVEANDDIARKIKNGWQIQKLARSLQEVQDTATVVHITYTLRRPGSPRVTLRFAPVSGQLQKMAEQLGDHLHFRDASTAERQVRWSKLEALVNEVMPYLKIAASSDLLAPPILDPASSRLELKLEFHVHDPRMALLEQLFATQEPFVTAVEYFSIEEALAQPA